jgi:DNA-binding transcriptional regulator YhcF (GntR family)
MPPPPTLRIDPASTTPVYRQIVDGIRSQLVEGLLAPGNPLPTVRELALDLGVHFNTVAEAYRLLSAEGWLDLKRRRGAVVMERRTPPAPPNAREHFALRLRQMIAQALAEGLPAQDLAAELEAFGQELTNEHRMAPTAPDGE